MSKKILNRSPNGEFWGSQTTSNASSSSDTQGSSNILARYQMVHRLVHEKLASHKRLIEILIEMVISLLYLNNLNLFNLHT